MYLRRYALQPVGDIADIACSGTRPIAEVVVINRSGIVETECRIDHLRIPAIAGLLKVLFEVLCFGPDHAGNIVLKRYVSLRMSSRWE